MKNEQTAPSRVVTNSLHELRTPDIEFSGYRLLRLSTLRLSYPTVSHVSNMMRVRKISCHKSSRVSVVCQQILTYDQLDLAAIRKSEMGRDV